MNSAIPSKPVSVARFVGECSLFSLIVTIGTGLCLAWYFVPSPEKAALSVAAVRETVFAGSMMIAAHHIAAAGTVLFTLCLMVLYLFGKTTAPFSRRVIIIFAGLIVAVIAEAAGGVFLSGNDRAVALVKSLFFKNAAGITNLPSLVDAASLLFTRLYFLHIAVAPALIALGYIALARQSAFPGQPAASGMYLRFALYLVVIAAASLLVSMRHG